MTTMKNLIYILIALSFAACDVTDIDPKGDIPQDLAFTDESSVRATIAGCYDNLQSSSYYGRNYLVLPDLLANNLNHTGTTQEYAEFTNNSVQSDNFIIDGIWSGIYDGINRANMVIHFIDDAGLSNDDKNLYLAHAYFIRAFNHFNLVRMFGAVPVKTAPSTDPAQDFNAPRTSVDSVYMYIETDLNKARNYIAEIFTGSATPAVIKALYARMALYQGEWSEAKAYADTVISNYGYSIVPAFADLYPANNNPESIFQAQFSEQDNNILAQYFYPTSEGGRHEFTPSDSILSAFEAGDVRFDESISEHPDDGLYVDKYRELETRSDNVYLFRLAEMYLIRAEAETMLNGDVTAIQDDINTIRNRAGVDSTNVTDYNQLQELILQERRREFAFEGHYWFDLVRTGKAIDELETVTSTEQYLMPIPLSEMQTNDRMTQNPGY